MSVAIPEPVLWFDRIRESDGPHRDDASGKYFVTRYESVRRGFLDERLGAPGLNLAKVPKELHQSVIDMEERYFSRWPVFSDSPQRSVARRALMKHLRVVDKGTIASWVDSDEPTWNAHRPFTSQWLLHLLKRSLISLLDVEQTQFDMLLKWSDEITGYLSAHPLDRGTVDRATDALASLEEFVIKNLQTAEQGLGLHLRSLLEQQQVDQSTLVGLYGQILTGTLEPTLSAIAVALEQLTGRRERSDEFEFDGARFTHEALRLASPFHYAPRRALEEVEIDGGLIPAGSDVVLCIVAANRDPGMFPDPGRFELRENSSKHLSFGLGGHSCPGARLAHQLCEEVTRACLDLARNAGSRPVTFDWDVSRSMRKITR